MPVKDKNKSSFFLVVFSFFLTLCIFFILSYYGKNLIFLKSKIIIPLSKFIFIVFITLLLTSYIEAKGWITKFSGIFKPIMRFSNLSSWSISSFTSAFLSGIVANTILFNAYTEKHINKKELFITNMLNNSIPAYLLHLPAMAAILLPILGKAGIIYTSVTFFAAIARGFFIIFLAKFFLKKEAGRQQTLTDTKEEKDSPKKNIFQTIKKNTLDRFIKIFTYTLPIYSLTVLMQELGFFGWLQDKTANFFISLIPIEGLSVIIFSIIMEFNAGAVAAGALLNNGVLDIKQTVLALVIGSIIATPIRAIKHQLPMYMGIYTPFLGFQLIIISQILRIISIILAGLPLFLFFYYK